MEKITSRAVIGEFKRALEIAQPPSWVGQVANTFQSDQASEEYAWLSATPALREWVGGRNAKGFTENALTITNKHFEATLEVLKRDMRRDKFGMIQAQVNDLVARAASHPASLLSALLLTAETATCYDGAEFFATDHEEGSSGAQSNDITCDVDATPAIADGTTTDPSVENMQIAIASAVGTIMSFKDSEGEPMNENASSFLVMAPAPFYNTVMQAVATPMQVAASQTVLESLKSSFSISAVVNPRLTWTEKIAVFRTDAYIKPFIFQRETAVSVGAKAEGSEFECDNDAHQYGVDYWGNVAFGLWQRACMVTFT